MIEKYWANEIKDPSGKPVFAMQLERTGRAPPGALSLSTAAGGLYAAARRLSGSPQQRVRRRAGCTVGEQPWLTGVAGGALGCEQADRAEVLRRLQLGDVVFRMLTRAAASLVLLVLGGVIVSLVDGAWPALRDLRLRLSVDRDAGTR